MDKSFPELKTSRLFLRQFNENDLVNVFRGLSHADVVKYYGVSYSNLEETKKQIAWFAEIEKNETGIWWAICSPDNEIFYGGAGLYYMNHEHKKAELGFWLLREHWGMGIVSEAILRLMDFGFNKINLHRIEAQVETENSASKRVMEKLGFKLEGTLKDYEIKNGRYISIDIYARINNSGT